MIFREHRGGLEESMATCITLPSRHALLLHLRKLLLPFFVYVTDEKLHIREYNKGRGDARIGWSELYIVTIDGFGVIGWTNAPCGYDEEPEIFEEEIEYDGTEES